MRRGFLLFLLSVICLSAVCAADPVPVFTDPYGYRVVGFVDSKVFFQPTVFYDVLPFDLDGADVRYNSNKEIQVQGLAIASYSLISNTIFHLYVSQSPLVLNGQTPSGKLGSIDYRLYMMIGSSSVSFGSCLSDEASSPKDANNRIVIDSSVSSNGMVYLNDKYIYVSLEDDYYISEKTIEESTGTVIENLAPGTYSSTIHFLLEEN